MASETFREFSVTPTLEDEPRATEALDRLLTGRPHLVRDRAVLLIAELLAAGQARADRLGDDLLRVRVISDPQALRIEVRDRGDGTLLRTLRRSEASAGHGWSPHLLNTVSDRWGLVSSEEGTWVWFELEQASGEGA